MAASSTFFSPSLFLCVLVLIDITLAVSLDTDMKLKSENNNHLQNQETWPQQPRSGHHHKHGLAKKGRVLALPVRGQPAGEEALRVGSGAPAMEELVPLGQPAALKQDKDKDVFLGFELPHAERENQSPGSERGKKQNREQRRHSRRDRLKHHRGMGGPRGNGVRLKEGRIRLGRRKKFFTMMVVRHCTDCSERWCRHLRSGNGALSTDGAVGVPAQCRGWT